MKKYQASQLKNSMREKTEPTHISNLLSPALAKILYKVVHDQNKAVDTKHFIKPKADYNPTKKHLNNKINLALSS